MTHEDKTQTTEASDLAVPLSTPRPASRDENLMPRTGWAPAWLPIAAIILSLAYYYAVPSPLLSLPGLLAFAVLAWLRLDLALCLLPLTFPFWFVPKRVAGSAVFPLSEIALAVCVAVALVQLALPILSRMLDSPPQREDSGPFPPKQRFRPLFEISRGPLARVLPRQFLRAKRAGERRTIQARPSAAGPPVAHTSPNHPAALTRLLHRAGLPILLAAALLLLGTALGVLIARRPHEALRAFRWEVAEPLLYAALILLFLRKRYLRLLVAALLGAAFLLAALAAIQVFWLHVTFLPIAQQNHLIPYVTPTGSSPRATAFIFGSGNTLGAWMVRALPLAFALALAPRGLPRRWRLGALLVALACVPALLWSDSRGALLAAVLACAIVAILSLPRPRWAIGVSAAGALVALVVVLANRGTVLTALLTGHNDSGEVRTLVWLAAWHMIRDHPLLGIGPDQFLYYYSSLYTNHPYWILYQNGHRTLAWTEPSLAQPHNIILDLWLSGGILALAGFLLLLATFWRRCWRIYRSARTSIPLASHRPVPAVLQPVPARAPAIDGREQVAPPALALQGRDSLSAAFYAALTLGLGASVLAGILHGMVDNAYFEPDLALLFWWAIATLAILASSTSDIVADR